MAIIVAAVVIFWIKKHPKLELSSGNVMDETGSSITVDNNLKTVMEEDDPFAGDFNNDVH